MDLKLSPEQFEQLVSAAIMQQLTPEQREEILKNAITHLLTKPDSGYSSRRVSPLQEAFNMAIGNTAHRFAREWLEAQPGMKQEITNLVAAAYERVMSTDRESMIDRIAAQMSRAFERDQ